MASNTRTAPKPDAKAATPQAAPRDNLPAAQQQKKTHPVVAFKEYATQRLATLQELPHIDPQQLLSVALTAIQRKPDLMKCTPQSLWNSCVLAAQDGLLPDGREGAIVPYGENLDGKRVAEIATWMPMVEGLRKKVRNSGKIKDWYVEIVYAGDFFRYRKGDDPRLEHEPVPPSMRTKDLPFQGIIAAYSIAVFTDGTKTAPEVMWIEEIEKVRAKSKAKNGPWQDAAFYSEMCKKVVARRHYKQLPKAPGLDKLIQRDDDDYDLDRQDETLVEHRNQRRITSTTDAFDRFAGGGQAIEHEDGDQDDRRSEFDDDQSHGEQAQEKSAEPTREDPISSGQSARSATTNASATAKKQPTDEHSGADAGQTEADHGSDQDVDSGAEGTKSFDQSVGEDERRWPPGEVPSNPDEYEHYVETKLSDFTNGDEVAPWWKSKEESDLRRTCGVSRTLHDELRNKAALRANELRSPKA